MTVERAAADPFPFILNLLKDGLPLFQPTPFILNLLKDGPPPFRPILPFLPPFPSFNKFRMSGKGATGSG